MAVLSYKHFNRGFKHVINTIALAPCFQLVIIIAIFAAISFNPTDEQRNYF